MVKLNTPKRLTADFRIITPMFIGDGRQQATMVYPQSFKGALRFWWRALMWAEFRSKVKTDVEALQALHEEDIRLFGGSAEQSQPASISIKLSMSSTQITEKEKIHAELKERTAVRYLGYGVVEAFSNKSGTSVAGRLIRECLNPQQSFTVTLISKDKKDLESVIPALKLLGLLGGLGAKARKGYGSIQLISLTWVKKDKSEEAVLWTTPKTITEYQQKLTSLLEEIVDDLPPFTAFSKQSLIVQTVKADDAYEVLNHYGKAMMRYRSWGKDGQVLGDASEKNFKKDHDWSKGERIFEKEYPDISYRDFHPERAVFGLPHSYSKSLHVGRSLKKKSGYGSKDKVGRRASPLFFHVYQLENEFIGVSIFLPAQFLPKNEKISIAVDNKVREVEQNIQWEIIGKHFLQDKQRFSDSCILFSNNNVEV